MYTEKYQKELFQLHKHKAFGAKIEIPAEIERCIKNYNIRSILDFGCGKGNMLAALKNKHPDITVYGYDAAQPDFNKLPDNVDMIFSTDVLEHIEPELLEETILDLADRTNKIMFHLIACHPAKKYLSDGRNAHLIIENPLWWQNKLQSILDWQLVFQETLEYTTTPKKGDDIYVVKYLVTLKK